MFVVFVTSWSDVVLLCGWCGGVLVASMFLLWLLNCVLCFFVVVCLWLWCQLVFVWLFLCCLCVHVCCYVVLLCLVCRLLVVFCVIVCVVAVMNSLVGVVRVVAVLDLCECMYVGTRGRSWCLTFLS